MGFCLCFVGVFLGVLENTHFSFFSFRLNKVFFLSGRSVFFPKFKNICVTFALIKHWWFESTRSEFEDFSSFSYSFAMGIFYIAIKVWVDLFVCLRFCNLPPLFFLVKESKVKLCSYWDSEVLESVLFLSFCGNGCPWGTGNSYLSCMTSASYLTSVWPQCSLLSNTECSLWTLGRCDLTVAGKEQMPVIFMVVRLCTEHNKWIKFSRRLRP